MKKAIIILMLLLFCLGCKSQNVIVNDISNNLDTNYFFARIDTKDIIFRELWNGGQYVKVFKISDSKATPENYFEGTDEVLISLIISTAPDGDYYTNSKLYKIEGLYNPSILEIKEEEQFKFTIKLEHGVFNKREVETFEFSGVQ
ncbi:short chain dehydrogenase [Xanthomarina gelatinilytica]|uniref:Short chain dehydrogenase n=1 Tax=Xanthomarina gelatinilytica TaxID=1137281 RepID=M7MMP3_9FLAO|nr:hypothetical protein [Xanthomarina gelatinilytica]EMQ96301.1 short chain dehydrogenase [Xanthomarina gelatinilytica]